MHLKLNQKGRFKKQQKQLVIYLEIKLLIKLQEPQKRLLKIIQKQMKKKYIKKDIYPQKKEKKLLMT